MASSNDKKFGTGSLIAAGLGGLVVGNVTAGDDRLTQEVAQMSLYNNAAVDDGYGRSVYYGNCSEARLAGAAPVYRGQPGYAAHLDRDNDGVGCE